MNGFYFEALEDRTLLSMTGVAPEWTHDGIGLCDLDITGFYLKIDNEAGYADASFVYGPGDDAWVPLAGDWTGDGTDTVGLYDPRSSVFYLRNSNDAGFANITFLYGVAHAGWLPMAGDWNGNGIDTVGLYDPDTSKFYLKNANNTGNADASFFYGPAGGGWTPIAGDWNGDGTQTVGLYDPVASVFYLRNSNEMGYAGNTFSYGPAGGGWLPLRGDWLGNGTQTVGLYDPTASVFYLRDSNSSGLADTTFAYGPTNSDWLPLAGDWDGDSSSFLTAAGAAADSPDVSVLTTTDLQPMVGEAVARWTAAGLDDAALAKLAQVRFVVADLPDSYLGKTQANTITIDRDAAGHGWFVDPTPARDEEFSWSESNPYLTAIDPQAVDRIDLLSVLEHELGHVAGLDDLDALADDVMCRVLGTGVRWYL